MEVRIGIVNTPRELSFESTQSPADLQKEITAALGGAGEHLTLTDHEGRVFVIPVANLAYVEIGNEKARRIGFVG